MKWKAKIVGLGTGMFLMGVAVAGSEHQWSAGVHGLYTASGDIESPEAGGGLQVEAELGQVLSLELSAFGFRDEDSNEMVALELDVTAIALALKFSHSTANGMELFALAGFAHHQFDMDLDVDTVALLGVEPVFSDVSFNADVDDAFGATLGVGVAVPVSADLEVFAEYRHTFLEAEGDVEISVMELTISEDFDGSLDYGMFKVGANWLF